MRNSSILRVTIATALSFSMVANAWNPIAHYEITKDAGLPNVAQYAQLPDYAESWKVLQGFDVMDISHQFCWSHGVQDSGDTAFGWVPLIPHYPDDGRYPGPVMWNLVNHKLTGISAEEKAEMLNVSKGFIAHNAADKHVHWDYFKGGSATLWATHHQDKEKWADYWVYILKHFNGNWEQAFSKDGKLILVEEYKKGVPVAPPSEPMLRIMRLGQKVYRKNRRATEKRDASDVFDLQSTAKIKQSYNEQICSKLTAKEVVKEYTRRDFLKLEKLAKRLNNDSDSGNDWTLGELGSYYEISVKNVKDWIKAYCK